MTDPNTGAVESVEAPQEHPESLGGTDPSVEASNAPEVEQAAAEVPAQEEAEAPAQEAPAPVEAPNAEPAVVPETLVATEDHARFLRSRGYKVADAAKAQSFVDGLAKDGTLESFKSDFAEWNATPAEVPAQEAAHQYGASVNVEIDFEGHKVAHTFQLSTEPLVDALNRFAKAKLGIDLVALEDQFKVFLNGVEVDHKQSSANLGVADGDTLKLHV